MPKFALFLRRPGGSQPGQTSAAPSLINIRNVRIASPCTANWEEMKGSDWMRHCTQCNLNVYNFSAMTWKEVEKLIAGHQGRLCARFYRRADGTMLTQDCPKGLRAVARRVSRWAGAALSAMAVVNFAGAQGPRAETSQPLVQMKAAAQSQESAGPESAKLRSGVGATTGGVEITSTSLFVALEDAPFHSNLQPVPETPVPVPSKKKHKGWFRRHGSASRSSAGTADPPAVPRAGQPHAVLHLTAAP